MIRRLFGRRTGWSHDVVNLAGDPYLERWILWLGPCGSLRLHRFWRGDNERALHDHPWPFVTFPLQAYREVYWCRRRGRELERTVRAFRFAFRRGTHRHIVRLLVVPTWTIVWAGPKSREWGFYPTPSEFVPWHAWVSSESSEAAVQ